MSEPVPEDRQQIILQSAQRAFAAYGFRKTSMDDIAQGAGMSRPALYLHFRNKEDILRCLVGAYYDQAAQDVEAALARPGRLADVLAGAMADQAGPTMAMMLASPHGRELIDNGYSVAGDLVESGEARLRDLYAGWLSQVYTQGATPLSASAEDVADTLCAAIKGLKTMSDDYEGYAARLATLAALVGAGLEAG